MYIHQTDAHSHIDFSKESDFSQLYGVNVCVSACFSDDWILLQKFDKFPVVKSYGLHPYLKKSYGDNAIICEEELFESILPNLQEFLIGADAIGEIGLDKRIEQEVSIELQQKLFCTQLELAEKYKLPAIIHCVGKWGMLLDVLKSWTSNGSLPRKFLLHSANCSSELVEVFSELGGYFSFGMRELRTERGSQCAKLVSTDRILIESDSFPSREILDDTLQTLAEMRNENAEDLSEKIYSNFSNFYKNG